MFEFVDRHLPRLRGFAMSLATAAAMLCYAPAADANDSIVVVVDQARLVRMPDQVATIVVGNPLIADVLLQPNNTMVVTGKGYGSTNVLALNRAGEVLVDRQIQVEGPREKVVTIYRGTNRESYSCTPNCERRTVIGDAQEYFSTNLGQSNAVNQMTRAGEERRD